jgi:eukaryotic-like serine/threonine-protein kinase
MVWGIGTVIENRYRIERVLHDGPRSWIAAASALALDGRAVTIKVLQPAVAATDIEATTRFISAARSASAVANQHVVSLFDIGSTGDTMFLVQEALEGTDLAALLRSSGPFDGAFAVELLREICDGVGAIHAAGLAHRAIQPSNLFVQPDGKPFIKILDFYFARPIGAPSPPGPARSGLIGVAPYAAPEQLRDPPSVDERADVWSIGAVGWELMTGRPPSIVEGIGAQVPANVSARLSVLRRCLAYDREQRYRTTAELAAALAPL